MIELQTYPPPALRAALGAYFLAKAQTKRGMRELVRAEAMLSDATERARVLKLNGERRSSEASAVCDDGARFLRDVIAFAMVRAG